MIGFGNKWWGLVMRCSSDSRITRRRLIGTALAAGSYALTSGSRVSFSQTAGPFSLPPLPYAEDALSPVISATTISFHYGKHHKDYIDNLNKAVADTELKDEPLEDVIKATAGDRRQAAIYVNAAQAWNHAFYWNSMRPNGGGPPTGAIADRINGSFGDYTKFRQEFVATAVSLLGSGWVWLVQGPEKKVVVVKTMDAGTPIIRGKTCLLTCDVWEHAYYIDYQNRRLEYVNAWLDNLVNWEFALQRLTG
jgi:superoxide dismutase, Fe-Mn family